MEIWVTCRLKPPIRPRRPPRGTISRERFCVGSIETPTTIIERSQVFWIISGAHRTGEGLPDMDPEVNRSGIKEYRLSDFGRYLVNPNTVEIKKRLIGCELHPKGSVFASLQKRLHRFFRRRSRVGIGLPDRSAEVVLSNFRLRIPRFNAPDLQAHLDHLAFQLRAWDTVVKRLDAANPSAFSHVIGICEDIGGNYSYLKLQGDNREKINYIMEHVAGEVGVVINQAQSSEGSFELRGFDFSTFAASRNHRLITYQQEGRLHACLLDRQGQIDFRLEDARPLLKYLLLLEHALKANPAFLHAFEGARAGNLRPVRLLFNRQLEIDYSKANFPEVYRNVFEACQVAVNQRNLIKPILNYLQLGITLNYLPRPDEGSDRLYTFVSVLHDFRALEPLKKNLPRVYSEMGKRAQLTEAGRFYLLDSIKGFTNA
jgi:hypothetical protein